METLITPTDSTIEETTQEGHATSTASKDSVEAALPSPRRNHFQPTDDPKVVQFSARARQKDADRIKEALEVRKGNKDTYDIVCLVIDCLDYIEADMLQTFKTKKKR